MAQIGPLCDICGQLEWDPVVLAQLPLDRRTWGLGPISRIRKSNCRFCILVNRAILEYQRISPTSDKDHVSRVPELELCWFNQRVPSGRGAFAIQLVPDIALCFVVPAERDKSLPPLRDHYLLSRLESTINIPKVTRWLASCTSSHSSTCTLPRERFRDTFPGLRLLRFIDVSLNCLVEKEELSSYAALSYVWGRVSTFKLSKAQLREFLIPGKLQDISRLLPQTIRDAIVLTRKLGIPYLWVDALCLVQDDRDDVEAGVTVMDKIYERSLVTITAAGGKDADAGLPGVQNDSRKAVELAHEVLPGVSLGLQTGLDPWLRHAIYNTRGWTFQEHLLPRRALYFIDDKVFFRCQKGDFLETCLNRPQPWRSRTLGIGLTRAVAMKDPMADYSIMLRFYTRRALTDPNDILRGMAGLIRRFSDRMKCKFLEGMPTAAFDAFVIFQADMTGGGEGLHRRTGFPTYSWAGWVGGIENSAIWCFYPKEKNDWLQKHTWIVWYKRDTASGQTSLVWDPADNPDFPADDMEYVGYRERQPFRLPEETRLSISMSRTSPTEALPFVLPHLTYSILQFWTLAVYFKIENTTVPSQSDVMCQGDKACGSVSLDGYGETSFFDSTEPFEFILLCECNHRYKCLILEWSGGVAERRGTGEIDKFALDRGFSPGPTWKEVLLA